MAVHRDSTSIPDRVPPESVDLEMCVLGGVMLDPVSAYPIAEAILPKHDAFYLEGHTLMFKLMGGLHRRGIPPDMNAMLDELRSRELLDKVGGSGVVMGMLNSVPTAANVEYHSKKLAEKSALRSIIKTCTMAIDAAYRQDGDPTDTLNDLAADTARLADDFAAGRSGGGAILLTDALEQFMDELSDRDEEYKRQIDAGIKEPKVGNGIKTGFHEIDAVTGGFRPGELTVIGARPGVGKSALMLTMAHHMSVVEGKAGLLFSLEMDNAQLLSRLLAIGSMKKSVGRLDGISTSRVAGVDLSNDEWSKLTASYEKIADAKIWLFDECLTSPERIVTLARKLNVDYLMVDYLQLMEARGTNRVEEVSRLSRAMKVAARQLRVPLIVLSQLKRPKPGDEFKRPQLSDLRESGSIEQDADNVWFLWAEDDMQSGVVESVKFAILKHRNGPLIYDSSLGFYKELTRFLDRKRLDNAPK